MISLIVKWVANNENSMKISDYSKILDFSKGTKLDSRYVFDPKETHEHVFDLENSTQFLEKIFKRSDFLDFWRKNAPVCYTRPLQARFFHNITSIPI